MSDKHVHATGATRSNDANEARYDLIPVAPHRRLALRYGVGAVAHGDRNWEKGLPWNDTYNHLIRHLELWKESVLAGKPRSDDDLAAAAWGCYALMHFESRYFEDPNVFTLKAKDYRRVGEVRPLAGSYRVVRTTPPTNWPGRVAGFLVLASLIAVVGLAIMRG